MAASEPSREGRGVHGYACAADFWDINYLYILVAEKNQKLIHNNKKSKTIALLLEYSTPGVVFGKK